ncbi:hypothetical protein [Streptomyces sp. NPDC052042]|uniref:hypothetical protein n=1 Tax=Streptomyces sp. NPDC052042 TaxID=3365683 RepID=UPI0037D3B743
MTGPVLAVDQDTSGAEELVVRPEHGVIGSGAAPVRPRHGAGDAVEAEPADLLESVVAAGPWTSSDSAANARTAWRAPVSRPSGDATPYRTCATSRYPAGPLPGIPSRPTRRCDASQRTSSAPPDLAPHGHFGVRTSGRRTVSPTVVQQGGRGAPPAAAAAAGRPGRPFHLRADRLDRVGPHGTTARITMA